MRTGERDVAVMVAPGYKTGERRERDVVVKMYASSATEIYYMSHTKGAIGIMGQVRERDAVKMYQLQE